MICGGSLPRCPKRVKCEHMFDREYSSVRWIDPPIEVTVWPGRVWGPQRVQWGAATPLWVRTNGLALDDVPGRLVELLVTRCGDLVGRVQVAVQIDRRPSAEVLLLPWGTWEPSDAAAVDRLHEAVQSFGELDFRHHDGARPRTVRR